MITVLYRRRLANKYKKNESIRKIPFLFVHTNTSLSETEFEFRSIMSSIYLVG